MSLDTNNHDLSGLYATHGEARVWEDLDRATERALPMLETLRQKGWIGGSELPADHPTYPAAQVTVRSEEIAAGVIDTGNVYNRAWEMLIGAETRGKLRLLKDGSSHPELAIIEKGGQVDREREATQAEATLFSDALNALTTSWEQAQREGTLRTPARRRFAATRLAALFKRAA